MARWAMELQQYEMEVVHRPSEKMKHVDALSRMCYLRDSTLTSILMKNQHEDDRIRAMMEVIRKEGTNRDYTIKNDILYRIVQGEELIVVPESMHFEILRKSTQYRTF